MEKKSGTFTKIEVIKKVAIIVKTIPRYRCEFYNGLRHTLARNKIELLLFYGQPSSRDALKNDTVELDWAIKIPSKIMKFGKIELYWQPVLSKLKNVDLVIVEQASKLLVNYVLLFQQSIGIRKLAFWGHGKNFQVTSANPLAEWIKRLVSIRVHWWFAYNEMSASVVRKLGYPRDRITLVQNAVDTQFLIHKLNNLSLVEIENVRNELNLFSPNVGIYTGGLYAEKRISFLLESVHLIKQMVPDFEMIFIGDGIDAYLVEDAAAQYSWIHYVGPKFDAEKIPYYAISKIFLMPGLIGLGILDTFALETPLITTDIPNHSPEIYYLQNGINGLMVEDSTNSLLYANAAVSLLKNEAARLSLVKGCQESRNNYKVEIMIDRFADGILKALETR